MAHSESITHKQDKIWFITEDNILTLGEIRKIEKYLERNRERAVEKGEKQGVREWISVITPIHTGLRVSEVSRLTCGDIYLTQNCPFILVSHSKFGKSRCVKISSGFKEKLEWYLSWKKENSESLDKDAPFIISPKTRQKISVRGLQNIFHRVLSRAGVQRKKKNYHMARHTFATHLLKASRLNLIFVRDQLGHQDIKTTQIYLHVIPGEDQKALERMYENN